MNIETFKMVAGLLGSAIGAFVAFAFGGWTIALTILISLMAFDFVGGLVVAGYFKNSPKTPDGRIESRVCQKGLFRKGGMLAVILVAHMLDMAVSTSFIMEATIFAFIANEGISFVENLGLAGVNVPKPFKDALTQLQDKETKEDDIH